MPQFGYPHDHPDDVTANSLDTKHVAMSHDPASSVTIGTIWSDIKGSENWEKHIIHIYFFNMDISLIMNITGMKIATHVAENRLEGIVSQNFDISLSFCFILCRRLNFQKYYKKSQKLPFFSLKRNYDLNE